MFLDQDLRHIATAKDALVKQCALRRMMFQLDTLAARAKVRRVVSGLQIGLAVAELIKHLLPDHKDRKC